MTRRRLEELSSEEREQKLEHMVSKMRERCRRYKQRRYHSDAEFAQRERERALQRYYEQKAAKALHEPPAPPEPPAWRTELEGLFAQISQHLCPKAQTYVTERFFRDRSPTKQAIEQLRRVCQGLLERPPQLPPGVALRQVVVKQLLRAA